MSPLDIKVVKDEKVDAAQEVHLKITLDTRGERIFVQFSTQKPKLCVQKNFPDTFRGRDDANAFGKSIKSLADMKAYFKIKE